jgi:hypothetical protein
MESIRRKVPVPDSTELIKIQPLSEIQPSMSQEEQQ